MIGTMTDIRSCSSSRMANRIQPNHTLLIQAMVVVTPRTPMQPMEATKTTLPSGIPASRPIKASSSTHRKTKGPQVSRGRPCREM